MTRFVGSKSAETKRFLYYCVYAWGTPLILVLIVFLMNNTSNQNSIFHPKLGIGRCFLEGNGLELNLSVLFAIVFYRWLSELVLFLPANGNFDCHQHYAFHFDHCKNTTSTKRDGSIETK